MSTPGRGEDLPSLKQFRRDLQALDDQPPPATLAEAKARLQEALAEARAGIERAKRVAELTPQEREDLTLAAQRGQLGEGMRGIGDRVAAGDETWEAVFHGETDDTDAFLEFFDEQAREQLPALRQQIDDADLLR